MTLSARWGRAAAVIVASVLGACAAPDHPVSGDESAAPVRASPAFFPSLEDIYVGHPLLRSIGKAVAFDGKLWLLGSSGALAAVDLADGRWQMLYEDGVVDIETAADAVWIVRSSAPRWWVDRPSRIEYRVSRSNGDRFEDVPPIGVSGTDVFRALVMDGDRPLLVLAESVRVLSPGGSAWRAVALDRALDRTPVAMKSALVSGSTLYVGIDKGEFGGGADRIDLATGTVTDLCGTPAKLCGNVLDLIADPENPDCLIVSDWHVVRLCGDRADVIERRAPNDLAVAADGRVWGVDGRFAYRIEGSTATRVALPELEAFHGLYAIRSLPDVLVLFGGASMTCGLRGLEPSDSCGFVMQDWRPLLVAHE